MGNWSGPALDTNFSNFNQLTSNADVFRDATITGSDGEGGAFSASVPDVNTTFGVWSKFGGNNYDTSVGTGDFYALMSVNRSFLATWGCITPALAVAPVCRYYGWSK